MKVGDAYGDDTMNDRYQQQCTLFFTVALWPHSMLDQKPVKLAPATRWYMALFIELAHHAYISKIENPKNNQSLMHMSSDVGEQYARDASVHPVHKRYT